MRSKNFIRPFLFTTGLFLLLYILSYLMLPSNSMEEGFYKKMKGILSAPENTIDYIILGDSEGSTSISPMEIWKNQGYAGYNCGVPGQRLQDTYYLLKRLLKKQSPQVILLETNAFYRNFEYTNALQDVVDEATKVIFPVYKYHNSWKYFNFSMLQNLEHKSKNAKPNVLKGFHYNIIIKPYTKGPYINPTSKTKRIDDMPLLYLNKIADLCKTKNIQLILYSAPSPLCWTYEKHNAAAAFAEKNQLPYVDLNLNNQQLGIDWSKDTRDKGNHLNFYGAKKVTDYMGTYLSEHTNLSDHRKEKLYVSWNKELKKYLAITEQD